MVPGWCGSQPAETALRGTRGECPGGRSPLPSTFGAVEYHEKSPHPPPDFDPHPPPKSIREDATWLVKVAPPSGSRLPREILKTGSNSPSALSSPHQNSTHPSQLGCPAIHRV